jgi:hypothetical protein
LSVFLEENKDKLKMCGFQHISEWSQVEITPFKIDYPEETSDLWEKLYIWKKSGKSASLPKEISDSNKFVFFHPDYFENWIFNLHRCFAGRLYAVQDLIMEDWRLKQGNCGVYYNFHDIDTTFCNQAVFETIKNVDGNFINFTGRKDKEFPECPNPNKYEYRPSNYWCDVLKMQSENSSKTGIYKISAEQAFYMAKLGYVVIACWKNSIPKGTNNNINYSPHFVTVRPNNEEYKGIEFIKVAHVGGGRNEEKNILTAFDLSVDENKSSNIFFYCNINQCFI